MRKLEHLRGTGLRRRQRLLANLVDISRIDFGDVTPEPTSFAVAPLFEDLHREFARPAAAKGLEFLIDAPTARAHSDPLLVGKILQHLVSNAIAYTDGGSVRLRCARCDAHVRIEVIDTGIGIAADELPLIYDQFYQAGGTDPARGSYGLGLSIVRRLASLLGAEIHVRSELGRGSAFSLSLLAA
ncbi:MAG TPA: HAMP domain-containing sensor histidine kinase [Steroidobacteraceae bacterium]|nr:HAMP domain-containing sensor histidine kinase [Steroidobacteraceae bacterium]